MPKGETARLSWACARKRSTWRQHPEEGSVPASIYVTEPLGHNLIVDVRFGDRIIRARADRNIDRLASLQPDDPVYIRFDAAQIHVFDRVTGQRL